MFCSYLLATGLNVVNFGVNIDYQKGETNYATRPEA